LVPIFEKSLGKYLRIWYNKAGGNVPLVWMVQTKKKDWMVRFHVLRE